MTDLSDLPLFSWRMVIPFPIARQTSKVRDAAEELLQLDREDADSYAVVVSTGIYRRMVSQGFSDDVIQHEVSIFWKAVHEQMVRLAYGDRSTPGGAA